MAHKRGVEMTADEVAALVAEQRTVTWHHRPDGLPHLAGMWFAPDGEDLLMWTYRGSQKTRNVERDPGPACWPRPAPDMTNCVESAWTARSS